MTDTLAPPQQVEAPSVDALSVHAPVTAELPTASPPKIEVIARAIDVEGKYPRRVIEGSNHLGQLIRHLLPEEHAGNKQRVTNVLIREGFDCGTPAQTSTMVERVMAASPSTIAMYADQDGFQRNHLAFALRDKVYTATRVFSRYSDGFVEPSAEPDKLEEHREALKAFDQPHEIAAVGAVFAGLVAPLIEHGPLILTLADVTPDEADQVLSVARSIFDTECRDLTHVHRLNGAPEAVRFVASTGSEGPRKLRGRNAHAASPNVARTSSMVLAVADKPAADQLSKALDPSNLLFIVANSRPTSTTAEDTIQDCPVKPRPSLDYHGSVGAAFITELVKRRDNVIQNARDWIPQYRGGYAKQLGVAADDDENPALQTLTHVALLRFALSCATRFDVCPWTKEAVATAMSEIAARCHGHHMKRQHAFEREVVNAVKALARECAKVVKGRQLVLIEAAQFDECVVAHRDKSRVLAALRRKQLLVTTKGNAAQYQVRMPSKSDADARRWVYAIDSAALRLL
jgi:hypothetical protein